MPQLCERLAVKGNYVINIPPWQKTKTGQKLHQNLIPMKSEKIHQDDTFIWQDGPLHLNSTTMMWINTNTNTNTNTR